MERVKGIEPSSQAWEARILPLNHTRFQYGSSCNRFCPAAQQQFSASIPIWAAHPLRVSWDRATVYPGFMSMRIIVCLIGLAALLVTAGCAGGDTERSGAAYGGAYQGTMEGFVYGHGEFEGYPDYGGYGR